MPCQRPRPSPGPIHTAGSPGLLALPSQASPTTMSRPLRTAMPLAMS